MSRLLYLDNARPGGIAHWLRVSAAIAAAIALGIGVARFVPEPITATAPSPAFSAPVALSVAQAPAGLPSTAAVAADATIDAATPDCAIQQIEISEGSSPRQITCVNATQIRQNGSVRSYVVEGSGAESWTLQIDAAGGSVMQAALSARDGRRYVCEPAACSGVEFSRHDSRGVRSIVLNELRLAAAKPQRDVPNVEAAPSAAVSARLYVPADDQVSGLACTTPSITISTPDGAAQKFCGQGGAGFEVADDGTRNYRFQDHESRTLLVAVNAEQQVTRVEFGPFACNGSACSGASMTALAPESALSERTFFFGRTPLLDANVSKTGNDPSKPGMVLDGSVLLPAQE